MQQRQTPLTDDQASKGQTKDLGSLEEDASIVESQAELGKAQHAPAPAPTSSDIAAAGEQPASGADRNTGANAADGADITAGSMGSASSHQAGYVWPSDRRVTYAEFAAGRVRQDPLCSSLPVHLMWLPT